MRFLNEFLPSGRLTRTGFWLRHLTLVPLMLWLTIAVGQAAGPPYDLPFSLLTLLLLVSVWGRRLHDRGHSAWWLLAVLVPVLGALGLAVECGLRGSSARGARFGDGPGTQRNYLTVTSTSTASAVP